MEYINEGVLTNYRNERENLKLSYIQMKDSFENVLKKLIEEKIPFWFDCIYKDFNKVGFLMNESINSVRFNGYILDKSKSTDELYQELSDVLKETVVMKTSKLHVGRTDFTDLTDANDIDTITVVVRAFKNYVKDKNIDGRQVTGNKYECGVNIEFLCDRTRVNDLMDYIF